MVIFSLTTLLVGAIQLIFWIPEEDISLNTKLNKQLYVTISTDLEPFDFYRTLGISVPDEIVL